MVQLGSRSSHSRSASHVVQGYQRVTIRRSHLQKGAVERNGERALEGTTRMAKCQRDRKTGILSAASLARDVFLSRNDGFDLSNPSLPVMCERHPNQCGAAWVHPSSPTTTCRFPPSAQSGARVGRSLALVTLFLSFSTGGRKKSVLLYFNRVIIQ